MTYGPPADPHAKPTRQWGADFVGMDACNVGAAGVTALGEVWTWGEVPYCGDLGGQLLVSAVGGLMLTGTGRGYWVWLVNGDVHPFGDAPPVGARGQVEADPNTAPGSPPRYARPPWATGALPGRPW